MPKMKNLSESPSVEIGTALNYLAQTARRLGMPSLHDLIRNSGKEACRLTLEQVQNDNAEGPRKRIGNPYLDED